MDWVDIVHSRWMDMLRHLSIIASMPETCLPKKMLRWDILLGLVGWMRDILQICQDLDIVYG